MYSFDEDVDPLNPHYIGRFSRIGMGIADDKGRCIRQGVIRKLDATANAHALGLSPASDCFLSLMVRNIATGETLTPEQYRALPGFEGKLVWGVAGQAETQIMETSRIGGSCCINK